MSFWEWVGYAFLVAIAGEYAENCVKLYVRRGKS